MSSRRREEQRSARRRTLCVSSSPSRGGQRAAENWWLPVASFAHFSRRASRTPRARRALSVRAEISLTALHKKKLLGLLDASYWLLFGPKNRRVRGRPLEAPIHFIITSRTARFFESFAPKIYWTQANVAPPRVLHIWRGAAAAGCRLKSTPLIASAGWRQALTSRGSRPATITAIRQVFYGLPIAALTLNDAIFTCIRTLLSFIPGPKANIPTYCAPGRGTQG